VPANSETSALKLVLKQGFPALHPNRLQTCFELVYLSQLGDNRLYQMRESKNNPKQAKVIESQKAHATCLLGQNAS